MSDQAILDRLDRFETKLDRMADALSTLARVEERQTQQREAIERVWLAIDKHDQRIQKMEASTGRNTTILGVSSKLAMPIYGTILALLGWAARGLIGGA